MSEEGPWRTAPPRVADGPKRYVVARFRAPHHREIVVTQWSDATTSVRRMPHFGALLPLVAFCGVLAVASLGFHLTHVLELGGASLVLLGGAQWSPCSFVVFGSPAKLVMQHGRDQTQIFIDEPADPEMRPRLDEEALRWVAQQLRSAHARARAAAG